MTLWGFSYSTPEAYTGIYITDSDDGVVGLMNYGVTWQNNAWYLGGRYACWYISDLEALGMDVPLSSGSTSGSTSTKKGKGKPARDASPVPIAPSWLLFGTGVLPLYFMRRRRLGKKESQSL